MPERLEIHSATIEFEDGDENDISVGGYIVWDNTAAIVRWASLSFESCERWLDNHRYDYPDDNEDDDLS